EPSLENGLIDLYAGYAATDLNFVDKRQSADLEAGTDAAANVQKINTRLASKGVKALDPSPAVDQNAFAITKAEADQFHLTKLSDVTPAIAGQWTLGGPPECQQRPFCPPGVRQPYGANVASFDQPDA